MNNRPLCLLILLCLAAAVPMAAPQEGSAPAPDEAPAPPTDFRETAPPQWQDTGAASASEAKPEAEPAPEPPNGAGSGPPAQELPAYFRAHQQIWEETPAPAAAPVDEPASMRNLLTSDATNYFLRVVAILFILCGVIILGGYLVKRFGKRTPLLAGQRLGTVLGKVHLTPRASLHYVKSGDRVLVLGLTQNSIALLTEFNAEAFEADTSTEPAAETLEGGKPSSFLTHLRAAAIAEPKAAALADDDLTSLRSDIQRLQQYLQDSARETSE